MFGYQGKKRLVIEGNYSVIKGTNRSVIEGKCSVSEGKCSIIKGTNHLVIEGKCSVIEGIGFPG